MVSDVSAIDELKHSIKIYMLILGGATPELAVFLLKAIDFVEDVDKSRVTVEMQKLAFHIVESCAVYLQRSIDVRKQKAERSNNQFPSDITSKSDNLLVIIGRCRGLDDKISAKYSLLREIATILRMLGNYTKSEYPKIIDANGNVL